jgi:hypothetical protein
VFKSSYTRRAKDILSKVNRQVHVLTQDPDSTASAPKGRGVLAAYDEVLRTIESHPIMIIGGYDFERFDWTATDRLTRQLTVLSNRVDRAIRAAISKKFPDMLYPSEPSTLVKVWDDEGAFDVFDLMDTLAIDAVQSAVLPFGVGPLEGHNFKKWLKRLLGGDFSVHYDDRASVSTDPRRFLRRVADVVQFIKSKGRPMYALTMQAQTTANAQKLAQAVYMANPGIGTAGKVKVKNLIFRHVEAVVVLMSENPGMTSRDPRIQGILRKMAEEVRREVGAVSAQPGGDLEKTLTLTHEVAQDIIAALTSKELKRTWRKLSALLRRIERRHRSGQNPG